MRHGSGVREADSQLGRLNRVADRCCLDLIARKQRERLALTAVIEPDSELRAMPALETRSVLSRLLSHLEPKDRLPAQLLYGDGSSQGDVSKRLGWSRQTVNKHAARIRRLALQLAVE